MPTRKKAAPAAPLSAEVLDAAQRFGEVFEAKVQRESAPKKTRPANARKPRQKDLTVAKAFGQMPKPKAKKASAPAPAPAGPSKLFDLPAAQVLRALGAQGWKAPEALMLLAEQGVTTLNERTVANHLYHGRRATGQSTGRKLRRADEKRWAVKDLPAQAAKQAAAFLKKFRAAAAKA
jgi:hypothetical protein